MTRAFTGRHISAILVGFFALVIAVNLTMARLAGRTFGGALAENGYVASQDYNRWIARAAAQDRLGWDAAITVEDGRLAVTTSGFGIGRVEAVIAHPVGLTADRVLAMAPQGRGRFRSADRLPAGRWQVRLRLVDAEGRQARYAAEVRA